MDAGLCLLVMDSRILIAIRYIGCYRLVRRLLFRARMRPHVRACPRMRATSRPRMRLCPYGGAGGF